MFEQKRTFQPEFLYLTSVTPSKYFFFLKRHHVSHYTVCPDISRMNIAPIYSPLFSLRVCLVPRHIHTTCIGEREARKVILVCPGFSLSLSVRPSSRCFCRKCLGFAAKVRTKKRPKQTFRIVGESLSLSSRARESCFPPCLPETNTSLSVSFPSLHIRFALLLFCPLLFREKKESPPFSS